MTTLVTGATGLIGNNVVRLLLERGEPVRALVRESSDPRPFEGLDVETVNGDLRDETSVRYAMQGVSRVIHAAAHLWIGHTQLQLSRAINVEGTRHIAATARSLGIRMLYVSTVDTLGVGRRDQPATETEHFGEKAACSYVTSKREAEEVVRQELEEGLDATIVHPTFTIGPWDWKPSSGRMMLAVAQHYTPVAPSGGHTVADVRDVASGILSACEHGPTGEHYILGGESISYLDYWKRCAAVAVRRPPSIRMGPLVRLLAGRVGDLWSRVAGSESDINSAAIAISSQYHFYSSEKAERELSYAVRPLDNSIQDAWKWFVEYGYA